VKHAAPALLGATARAALLVCFACSSAEPPDPPVFRSVAASDESALMSVHGTSASDVWMVGADHGAGPLVLHWDGAAWQRPATGASGDLWWVHALPSGVVHMGGARGLLLAYRDGVFQEQAAPSVEGLEVTAEPIVFGVWAASEDDVYAVGSIEGSGGFAWHSDGQRWQALPLPAELPTGDDGRRSGLFKVWGLSAEDVWLVGENGLVLRGNAARGFERVESGTDERLFTVHAAADRLAIVGGTANGWALEWQGGELVTNTPPGAGPLQGVNISDAGAIWAVGLGGSVFHRETAAADWQNVVTGIPVQSLHAVWVDPAAGVWAVGGRVLTLDLDRGVALHRSLTGSAVPAAF
jgi:hypothetical protein